MKVYLERASWANTICLAVGFSWEDWHIREVRFWLDLILWSITLNFKLGEAKHEQINKGK